MKKISSLIMTLLMLVVPFMSALAIEGNYFVYTVGDEVNFYYNENDKLQGEATQDAGRTTIIINDEGENSQFVKTLLTGSVISGLGLVYDDGTQGFTYNEVNNAASPIKTVISWLNEKNYEDGFIKAKNEPGNVGFITTEEIIDVFKAEVDSTDDAGNPIYKINPDTKIGSKGKTVAEVLTGTGVITSLHLFQDTANTAIESVPQYAGGEYKVGFYTGSATDDGKIYVVDFTLGDNEAINAITVKPVEIPSETVENKVYYSLIGTVYFDKTYDCLNKTVVEEPGKTYSCYSCDDEYIWTEDGTQAEACTVVEKIKDQSKCVKPVQTGVEEYLPELIGVLAIGGIAIMLLKKKDLFRSI